MLSQHIFAYKTAVERYGQLSVQGRCMVSEKGDTVQLRGMSLYWSQWKEQYYCYETVSWLVDDWKCDVIRVAMGVEQGGYLAQPKWEMMKVDSVVEACIKKGIYVVIDYHAHKAHENIGAARSFFGRMAKRYGKHPNVLYEIYNEPEGYVSWKSKLKPYHQSVIDTIRHYDPDNIVICGSRTWSQELNDPVQDRLEDPNVMYTLHYYAYSHTNALRNSAVKALKKGLPIFVTEYGNCHYSGTYGFDTVQARIWWDLLDKYKISWCKWSLSDKDEVAAALKPGTGKSQWELSELTPSGLFVRNEIITKNTEKVKAERAREKARKKALKLQKKKAKMEKKNSR